MVLSRQLGMYLLPVFWVTTLFTSCEKEKILSEMSNAEEEVGTEIHVGEKIDSPFLLRNMQSAVDSLNARSGLKNATTLSATHLYVRFLPKDEIEYDRLVADDSLDFDPYPLDRVVSEGDSYHDPDLPKDAIQWQYTVVPADYDMARSGVEYEVLDELYILDEDIERDDITVEGRSLKSSSKTLAWADVVDEAVRQTEGVEHGSLKSKWTPCATIRAYDDLVGGYIPLQGVKVRIRYFAFLKAYHYTDANGEVSFGSKRKAVEYSIEWERDKWDIRDGGVQAYYNGPSKKGRWTLDIGSGTQKSLHYSAIHRALYKYYYGDCCGLVRPDKKLKISYQTGSDPDGTALGFTTSALVRHWNWIFSAIKIYEKGKIKVGDQIVGEKVEPVSGVFSTTLHELAHASHACRMSRTEYDDQTSPFIKESWAVAVEWYLTMDEYKKLKRNSSLNYIEERVSEQTWPDVGRSPIYSPLFIDMVDSINQSKNYRGTPNDEVSGYSMSLIDSRITSMKNYTDVENFIKNNRPSNVTLTQINNLLKLYKQKWEN